MARHNRQNSNIVKFEPRKIHWSKDKMLLWFNLAAIITLYIIVFWR